MLCCAVLTSALLSTIVYAGENRPLNQASAYAGQSAQDLKEAIPQPISKASKDSSGQTSSRQAEMFVMKDLLKDVPAKDRAEFLNNMIMEDGHLVTPDVAPLKRTLSDGQIIKILQALKPVSSAKLNPNRLPIRMSDALKDVPDDIRSEFMERLTFDGDVIVSSYIGGLRTLMSDGEIGKLHAAILPSGLGTPKHDSKNLCNDSLCYDAICTTNYIRKWCANSTEGMTCPSTCK